MIAIWFKVTKGTSMMMYSKFLSFGTNRKSNSEIERNRTNDTKTLIAFPKIYLGSSDLRIRN